MKSKVLCIACLINFCLFASEPDPITVDTAIKQSTMNMVAVRIIADSAKKNLDDVKQRLKEINESSIKRQTK
jgi:hypothetical protein